MTFPVLPANGPSGYNLTNSLRFRSSASAYLNRTPASASNRKTWTWSCWIKRGQLGTYQRILEAGSTTSDRTVIGFDNTDKLQFFNTVSTVFVILATTQVFRDASAWYHIVVAMDTTQATASSRTKFYVNGVQITSFSTANYVAQNADTYVNSAIIHRIGASQANGDLFDGYMDEVNFIDGQALTPSSFGSTNAVTGVWQPAKYAGTYGTNGFYLPFTNTTSTTTLGNDFSGNGNNWTTNNISLTPGVTYDSMTDVPTLTSPTAANYCVLNAASIGADATLSAANLNIAYGGGSRTSTMGTIGMSSGKWYWECTILSAGSPAIGITNTPSSTDVPNYPGFSANGWGWVNDGNKYNSGTATAYGATFTTNDIIGVSFDAGARELIFYKNGVSQGVAFTGLAVATYFPAFGDGSFAGTWSGAVNFGQRPFAYTPPSGFVALNTFNLPSSTIPAGNKFMDATTYTGNSGTQSIVNSGSMQPDWVWVKSRSNAYGNYVNDSVRGASQYLETNTTGAEGTAANSVTSFNSNGFSLGSNLVYNFSGYTYVGWQWKGGGTAVTNTAGSSTSAVSANTTSGFSVVTYTGTGANATVGHGLNVLPSMVIAKNRSGTSDWAVWHTALGDNFMKLNTTNPQLGSTPNGVFNVASFTSSVFAVGNGIVNVSASTYVAYCFAQIAGFSSFGSYTGNGSADGPFIYTGFRPRWIICKSTAEFGSWTIMDSARVGYNANNSTLYSDLTTIEQGYLPVDILSNGFKIRITSAGTSFNSSGEKYIYAAFAENPFKNALAR